MKNFVLGLVLAASVLAGVSDAQLVGARGSCEAAMANAMAKRSYAMAQKFQAISQISRARLYNALPQNYLSTQAQRDANEVTIAAIEARLAAPSAAITALDIGYSSDVDGAYYPGLYYYDLAMSDGEEGLPYHIDDMLTAIDYFIEARDYADGYAVDYEDVGETFEDIHYDALSIANTIYAGSIDARDGAPSP